MQLDALNPNIYSIFRKNYFLTSKLEKTEKTQGSQNLAFLQKSAYSLFSKFAIALKDFLS